MDCGKRVSFISIFGYIVTQFRLRMQVFQLNTYAHNHPTTKIHIFSPRVSPSEISFDNVLYTIGDRAPPVRNNDNNNNNNSVLSDRDDLSRTQRGVVFLSTYCVYYYYYYYTIAQRRSGNFLGGSIAAMRYDVDTCIQ